MQGTPCQGYNGGRRRRRRRSLKIDVKLFAAYRDRLGRSNLSLELEAGSTVAQLAERLVASYPKAFPPAVDLVVAVNQEYAESHQVLQEGDEVALIPPVSGGGL